MIKELFNKFLKLKEEKIEEKHILEDPAIIKIMDEAIEESKKRDEKINQIYKHSVVISFILNNIDYSSKFFSTYSKLNDKEKNSFIDKLHDSLEKNPDGKELEELFAE